MKFKFLLVLLVLSTSTFAQSYLITAKGDSIAGSFSIMEDRNDNEFVSMTTDDGKKQFRILETQKLVDGEDIYIPLLAQGKYRFGLEQIKGYVSIYLYTPVDSPHKFSNRLLIKMDGTSLQVPGIMGFRKFMSDFMYECPEIADAIKKKEYKRSEIDRLVIEFNACIDKKEALRLAKTAKPEIPAEKASDIDLFKKQLETTNLVANKDEVLEIFNDIVDKLSNNDAVPNYLKNAFLSAIEKDEQLLTLGKQILSEKD